MKYRLFDLPLFVFIYYPGNRYKILSVITVTFLQFLVFIYYPCNRWNVNYNSNQPSLWQMHLQVVVQSYLNPFSHSSDLRVTTPLDCLEVIWLLSFVFGVQRLESLLHVMSHPVGDYLFTNLGMTPYSSLNPKKPWWADTFPDVTDIMHWLIFLHMPLLGFCCFSRSRQFDLIIWFPFLFLKFMYELYFHFLFHLCIHVTIFTYIYTYVYIMTIIMKVSSLVLTN